MSKSRPRDIQSGMFRTKNIAQRMDMIVELGAVPSTGEPSQSWQTVDRVVRDFVDEGKLICVGLDRSRHPNNWVRYGLPEEG